MTVATPQGTVPVRRGRRARPLSVLGPAGLHYGGSTSSYSPVVSFPVSVFEVCMNRTRERSA